MLSPPEIKQGRCNWYEFQPSYYAHFLIDSVMF
uniref:Uncharacterized protein n=1 Tax=Triticum urartu TaxID=4572 RepID=A0A8R7PQY1_TRIUA